MFDAAASCDKRKMAKINFFILPVLKPVALGAPSLPALKFLAVSQNTCSQMAGFIGVPQTDNYAEPPCAFISKSNSHLIIFSSEISQAK
jgi:hypothetical protein